MFESLGYAGESRATARRLWSLPLAAGVQLTVAATYAIYSLFATEILPPPPTWISSLPPVPVTLMGGGRPKTPDEIRPSHAERGKHPGLVDPGRETLVPVGKMNTAANQEPPDGTLGNEGGVPGLDEFPWLGTDTPVQGTARDAAPLILSPEQVVPPRLVRQVNPVYPPPALAMRMTGTVTLQAVVDETGRVVDVEVMGSTNAIFNQAAMDAVRQWQYTRPISRAGGQAVACYMRVVVNFQVG